MKKFLVALVLSISVLYSYGQNTSEDEWGAWYMYFGTNQITDQLSIHSEAQFRFYEITDSFNQLLLRIYIE